MSNIADKLLALDPAGIHFCKASASGMIYTQKESVQSI